MYELDDIIKYDSSIFGNSELDIDVKELAEKYSIEIGNRLQEFTDQINFLVDSDEDRRQYRKTLQVFEMCEMKNIKVKGAKKTIEVDDVLFLVFHNLKQQILESARFVGYSSDEVMNKLKHLVKKEKDDETFFKRKIITTLVAWLRDEGIFKKSSNPKNIGNKESAFIYDLLETIGFVFDKYPEVEKGMEYSIKKGRYHAYDKFKKERIKSYL